MNQELPIRVETKIVIRDVKTNEILREGKNAVHPQNFSRVIARALANEPNSIIHRIAFGNGGTYTDAAGNVVFNPPNDGNSGGWEARLYNETYSEIVDELHPDFKSDPGSADVNTVRMAGGASPADDPEGGGVTSVEVGRKSNIVVSMVINENEPNGQVQSHDLGATVEDDETYFMFDEIGLFSPGKPAKATSGYSTVNVGTGKTSSDTTNLTPNTNYNLEMIVDGASVLAVIHTPANGTGSGGSFTYGDICEGINSGSWLVSGDDINDLINIYITDRSGGAYPSIVGMQSYGYLTFESKSVGVGSSVELTCSAGDSSNFFNVITNGVCGNVNVNMMQGLAAGVANDPVNPENERERLLTHFIFDPVLKSRDRAIGIEYTLTVSVGRTVDSQVVQVTGTPVPTITPTPTPTPSPVVVQDIEMLLYAPNGSPYTYEEYDENNENQSFFFTVKSGGGIDSSEFGIAHLHNLPSGTLNADYKFIVDDWTLVESSYPEGGLFVPLGSFAAAPFGTNMNYVVENVGGVLQAETWDTDVSEFGTNLVGLTKVGAMIPSTSGSGTVYGTANIKLIRKSDDAIVITKPFLWKMEVIGV